MAAAPLAARQAAERELEYMLDLAMKTGLMVGFECNLEEIPKLGLCQSCGRKVRDWALRMEGDSP